jgi:hypothetical protein
MTVLRFSLAQHMSRIRGQLPIEEPGARGIEHWARNPDCQRLGALMLMGISPETAAHTISPETLREGQSPFAYLVGNTFERVLFAHHAARVVDLYCQAGLLPASPRVVNLDTLVPHTSSPAQVLARRRQYTQDYLRSKLQGDPQAPHLILHGRLRLTINDTPHDIEPDLLIASDTDAYYRPGEIKSFLDRGGETKRADLRSALRQAAVAVVGLHQLLAQWGITQPDILAPAKADLILRVPGSYHPTLRPMTVQQEYASIQAVIQQAPQDFQALEQLLLTLGPSMTLDQSTFLDQIPAHFLPTCKEFCPLASYCKKQALVRSDLMVLGMHARQELAPAGTLLRAWDLLHGQAPQTPAERLLAQRLLTVSQALQKVVIGDG